MHIRRRRIIGGMRPLAIMLVAYRKPPTPRGDGPARNDKGPEYDSGPA